MSVYTPHFAPIVVLAFLGTTLLAILSVFVGLLGALRKSRRMATGGMAAGVVLMLVYGSILLAFSFLSRDVVLLPGAWKYFCEIDCHIAYSVGRVQTIESATAELEGGPRSEQFAIIELKTWFDPSTISPHRGNGPLMPSERRIRLIDSGGHEHSESPQKESLLAAKGLHSTPLRTRLRPGESYVSYLVFQTPVEGKDFRVLVTSAEELDRALWGHEISPYHGKAYFQISDAQVHGSR